MQDLTELFQPVVSSMGYELVGVEFNSSGKHGTLRVYIDQPDGITVDDCAAVSHQISGLLDVEDPIDMAYDLEVSSPGLDRPLFKEEDFQRFSGNRAKIKLAVPLQGRKNFTGVLKGAEQGKVLIEVDNELFQLDWSDIARANIVADV